MQRIPAEAPGTVVDAEVVEPLAGAEAERLDQRIRLLVGSINDNLVKLYDLVEQAKAGEIHKVLGFTSWTAYVADVFTVQVRLDRGQRRELVGYLSGEGMSQRAVADVVGVDQKTVGNDLRTREENSSPEPGAESDHLADELIDAEPKQITGRDGKTYPLREIVRDLKQPKPSRPPKKRKPKAKAKSEPKATAERTIDLDGYEAAAITTQFIGDTRMFDIQFDPFPYFDEPTVHVRITAEVADDLVGLILDHLAEDHEDDDS